MKLLNTKEAALIITEYTGKPISQRQVRHEIQLGYLKAEKISNTYLIRIIDVKRYKRRHPGKQTKSK